MRKVDWTPLVELRDGTIGRYIEKCPLTGKHRVQTFKFRGNPVLPPVRDEGKDYTYTTWLLDDFGSAVEGLRPDDKDWIASAHRAEPSAALAEA